MNIGFIGTGNMGGAILKGFKAAHQEVPCYAYRRDAEKLAVICRQTGAVPCGSIGEVTACSDILFLGVKPVGFPDILPEVASALHDSAEGAGTEKVIVSMAAGISLDFIRGYLGEGTKLVRIMPNTPAMIGLGMTSVSRSEGVTDDDMAGVLTVLESLGKTEEVPEELIHCVIGVSGSSPAYTYMYIEALMKAAVRHGMTEQQARVFAAQSVLGAASMVLSEEDSPEQLRINVCSPGGTTIEAVDSLMEDGFMDIVEKAFDAAAAKSEAMTK